MGLRELAWLGLLSGAAILLNSLPVPLFFGIHLLLVSVPPILALLLWRTWSIVIVTLEMVWGDGVAGRRPAPLQRPRTAE